MVALDTGLSILPISISGASLVQPPHTFRLRPGVIRMTVHPPVDTMAFGAQRRDELMAEVRRSIASGLMPSERNDMADAVAKPANQPAL